MGLDFIHGYIHHYYNLSFSVPLVGTVTIFGQKLCQNLLAEFTTQF